MFIPDRKKYKGSTARIKGISFYELLNIVNVILKNDKKEPINVDGFKELVNDYYAVDKDNLPKIYYLMISSNCWSQYFDECMQYLNYVIYTKETQKRYLMGFLERKKKGKKQSENQLNIEKRIAYLTQIIIKLKLFSKYLIGQRVFSTNISYHCKCLYNASVENFLYKPQLDREVAIPS